MIAVIIAWIAYLYAFVRFLVHGFRIGSFFTTLLILAGAFLVLIFLTCRRLFKPSRRMQQAADRLVNGRAGTPAPAADDSGSVTFRVAGATFDNDDGTSRQEILRHLRFGDPPWADDPEDLTATLEEETFEGEPAFAVLINGYRVGSVPKKMIPQVQKAQEHVATCFVSSVRILGGGTSEDGKQLSYGCEITLEY